MSASSLGAKQFVQSSAGLWTPVGYGATNLPAPAAVSSPNAMANSSTMAVAGYLQPYGSQRVTNDAVTLFYEGFDSTTTLDSAVRWTLAGTNLPTSQSGYLSINAGVASGASSRISSQPAFTPPGQGFVVFATEISIELGTIANVYRFWGFGSDPTTPAYQGSAATTSLALYDGVGFEVDSSGSMYAVIYQASVLVYRSPAIPRPADTVVHRYMIMRRHDAVYWYTDNLEYPVASANKVTPSAQSLPIKFVQYNGTTPGQAAFNVVTATVADTTGASRQISDGAYPWRKAKVNATGDQVVSLSSPAAIAGGYYAGVSPYGTLRVSSEPTTMFAESFEDQVALDPLKWTVTGSTTTLTPAQGGVQLPPAASVATASYTARLTSVPSFAAPGSGYLIMQAHVLLDFSPNTYRFFGFANDATNPAYQQAGANPSLAVKDGIGWEVDNVGTLNAVIYSNGTNSYRQSLSSGLWNTGGYHRYYLVRRESQVWWYIDSFDSPVASRTITGQGAWVDTLPIKFGTYNNSTAPTGSSFYVNSVSVGDSTAQNHTISDPTYQFRRVQVTPANHMKAAPYSSTVTNSFPSMTTAAATVLAANVNRVGATIRNDEASSGSVYIALGLTATVTVNTVLLAPGAYYEVPFGFTGVITGITASGTALLRVNELT